MDPNIWPAKAGWPARIYIQQLCEDKGCSPEDLPEAMNGREKWRERVRASGISMLAAWHDDDDDDDTYISIYKCVCCVCLSVYVWAWVWKKIKSEQGRERKRERGGEGVLFEDRHLFDHKCNGKQHEWCCDTHTEPTRFLSTSAGF